jgi:hypothetical protein
MASGPSWSHVLLSGNATDGTTGAAVALNGEYYVMNGRAAIASTDMPAQTKSALAASIGATPVPPPGSDEIIVVPRSTSDGTVAAANGGPRLLSLCSDSDQTYSTKSYSVNDSWPYTKSTDGHGFTGSASVNAGVAARFQGFVDYSIKHVLCFPYLVFHDVRVTGGGTVTANLTADASFEDSWSDEVTVANPTLGTVTIPGPIPIPITLSVPIRAGLTAQARADFKGSSSFSAIGDFSITCSLAGCSGTKEAVYGFTGGGTPTASVTGNAKVTPYAEANLHASIFSDWLASAEVGLRASLPTSVFAYAGNTCGDADGDGVNEWVTGASVDMSVAADVRASAEFVGQTLGPASWNVWNSHVGFWSLNGGVFDPMVTATDSLLTATVKGQMRPCYPFADAVSYDVAWGDGATTTTSSSPTQLFSQSHSYSTLGTKTIRVDALTDAQGRSLGTSATRNVSTIMIAPRPILGTLAP